MPIGAFARLSRLTVKAVRHYDAEGLLVPAQVDPHSGYRYYRADQVRSATTIALLRGLDVPLPVVREVLAVPAAGADVHLAGGAWASVLHIGPYPELPLTYTALLEHVRDHGHQPRGPFTETYLTDPAGVAAAELVTRVAVAVDG